MNYFTLYIYFHILNKCISKEPNNLILLNFIYDSIIPSDTIMQAFNSFFFVDCAVVPRGKHLKIFYDVV